MTDTYLEAFANSPDRLRKFQQEKAIVDVTELICARLDAQGLSRSDLARMLGRTKGWVTQLLDGENNKTIRTVADVFAVLGMSVQFNAVPIELSSAAVVPGAACGTMCSSGTDQPV